jgi:secreted trypsin-like serine protease
MNYVKPLAIAIALLGSTLSAGALNDDFIVRGQKAEAGEWPWQVRILVDVNDRRGFCGGSLIAPQWVLTAAHCTYGEHGAIGYGSTKRAELKAVAVTAMFRHPDYPRGAKKADIALLKLAAPVMDATTIAIADADSDGLLNVEGTHVTVTGWGALIEGKPDAATLALIEDLEPENLQAVMSEEEIAVPEELREVEVEVVNFGGCKDVYATEGMKVSDTEICAGRQGTGRDSCYGDSGGPLVTRTDAGWVQLGVVSWGKKCGHPFLPGIYSRIASFRGWIDETMAGN